MESPSRAAGSTLEWPWNQCPIDARASRTSPQRFREMGGSDAGRWAAARNVGSGPPSYSEIVLFSEEGRTIPNPRRVGSEVHRREIGLQVTDCAFWPTVHPHGARFRL